MWLCPNWFGFSDEDSQIQLDSWNVGSVGDSKRMIMLSVFSWTLESPVT